MCANILVTGFADHSELYCYEHDGRSCLRCAAGVPPFFAYMFVFYFGIAADLTLRSLRGLRRSGDCRG